MFTSVYISICMYNDYLDGKEIEVTGILYNKHNKTVMSQIVGLYMDSYNGKVYRGENMQMIVIN